VARPFVALGVALAALVAAPVGSATLPGRNGLIAFSACDPFEAGVYAVRPDGSKLRRLAVKQVDSRVSDCPPTEPAWSADGRRLLFNDLVGSHLVTARGRRLEDPVWAGAAFLRDGRIAATDRTPDGRRGRVVAGRVGSSYRRPLSGWVPFGDEFAIAPDGRRVTVTAQDPETYEHWIWRADRGHRPNRIARGAGVDWSPDGRRIAYATVDGLWVSRPDGSHRRELARLPEDAFLSGPAWAPDGRSLVSMGRLRRNDPTALQFFRPGKGLRRVVMLPEHLSSLGPPSWQPL
jgi:Tol biopolymer transport system component